MFAYQLALALGVKNVGRFLRELPAKEFLGWETYATLEPFGELRADYRAASIREMIHNVAVKKEHQKPIKDFLLKWETEEKKKQGWEEQLAIARIITAIVNAGAKEP